MKELLEAVADSIGFYQILEGDGAMNSLPGISTCPFIKCLHLLDNIRYNHQDCRAFQLFKQCFKEKGSRLRIWVVYENDAVPGPILVQAVIEIICLPITKELIFILDLHKIRISLSYVHSASEWTRINQSPLRTRNPRIYSFR